MLTRQVVTVPNSVSRTGRFSPQETQAISSAPMGVVANRKGKHRSRRKIAYGRYLQALLTKSEIELKPSQCKIQ